MMVFSSIDSSFEESHKIIDRIDKNLISIRLENNTHFASITEAETKGYINGREFGKSIYPHTIQDMKEFAWFAYWNMQLYENSEAALNDGTIYKDWLDLKEKENENI